MLKMASTQVKSPLKAGLILNVEVENALEGVVMVCLRHEGRTFRGILLDSDKGACPAGFPNKEVLTRDLNDKFGVPTSDIATIEADVVKQDPHSALSYRQSYFQNMPLPPPRPLLCGKSQPSPKPKLGPSYTTRTRPLKLRPRQMLCTKCKQECSKEKSAKRKLLTGIGGVPKKKTRIDPLKKTSTLKGLSLKKTIKISYATPQGKDQLTISPRSSGSKKMTAPQQNGKKSTASVQNKKMNTVLKSRKPQAVDKRKIIVNGFHQHLKKRKTPQLNGGAQKNKAAHVNGGTQQTNTLVANKVKTKTQFTNLKVTNEKEKENSLSAIATEEVITNGLKVHLVQELFVPCSRGKLSDTSSESSYASSISSRRSKKSRKCSSRDFVTQELSDSEKEPKRSEILISSNDQSKKVPPLNLKVPPLHLKVHKKNVTKYKLADGRTMCLGDIVWGKIIGFPWWPGRISQIAISRRDNGSVLQQDAQIRWMGATTVSHMPLEKLYPFLPYFKERYNKKRRGIYKSAISQAMEEAKSVSPEVRELNTMFETSQIC